jgi:hypothetical protein
MLGNPPDHMLDRGKNTTRFFTRRASASSGSRWTLKTEEECALPSSFLLLSL